MVVQNATINKPNGLPKMISKGELVESRGELRSIRETILRMVGEPTDRGLRIKAYDTEDWSLIDWDDADEFELIQRKKGWAALIDLRNGKIISQHPSWTYEDVLADVRSYGELH
jgi:hypothetical protein|nr:MAG TPA: hypothetical protein [Caudoviricetes sp.]